MAMMVGMIMTMLITSSSVFTSSITPLAGLGIIPMNRFYPLVLGGNIGTTITAILASLASGPDRFIPSVQIAFCHTIFNVTGIIIFYPIPFMRKIPRKLAIFLGKKSAKYRWFSVFYIFFIFLIIPGLLYLLSLAGLIVFWSVLIPILIMISILLIINRLQKKKPQILPEYLKNWDCLPIFMHSLWSVDKMLTSLKFVCFCRKIVNNMLSKKKNSNSENQENKGQSDVATQQADGVVLRGATGPLTVDPGRIQVSEILHV